jgi:hypothetical protein
MTQDTAERILRAGANLRLSGLSSDCFVELARIAREQQVQLEIKARFSVDALVEIAVAGGKYILIDAT